MIGLLLGITGTFFEEIYNSISKHKSKKHDILTLGAITISFTIITYIVVICYKAFHEGLTLHFNPNSIPLLGIRMILEIAQSYCTLQAIKHADRSTFSIIRILTIPLLVIADIFLGYNFSVNSLVGITIILFSFLVFNTKIKTINWTGWYYILFTAINAAITLSLFKYSISHYGNSVEIDQIITATGIFFFFWYYNNKKTSYSISKLIWKEKSFLAQGIIIGITSVLISYSYLYLNASEATTIKRAGEMFWSILFGFYFFKENHLFKKLIFALCIIIGLYVMTL